MPQGTGILCGDLKMSPPWAQWEKEDDDFHRWFAALKSDTTRKVYWYAISNVHRALNLRPKQIVAAYKAGGQTKQDFVDRLDEHIQELKAADKVPTAKGQWIAVVSLLDYRGAIKSAKEFEIKQPEDETIAPQHIPTQEEYEAMLRHGASARDRFLMSFLRWAGGRRGVANDPEPMRLRHLVDLDISALKQGTVTFTHKTTCAVLMYAGLKDGEIVRYKETYVSFFPQETMQLLSEYLQARMREGEQITADSYLFTYDRNSVVKKPFAPITNQTVSRIVSDASMTAGYIIQSKHRKKPKAKFTAHSLRRLMYNSLAGIDDVDKEALDGHVKGVKARYHGSVDDLVKVIEFMRGKYEFGMRHHLGTEGADLRKQMILDFARTQGLKDDEIATIQKGLGMAADVEALREAIVAAVKAKQPITIRTAQDGGTRPLDALLINETDLCEHLALGWEVVRELSDGKIAIRRNH
ncbi:MAG: hypothetical protein ABSF82_03475 [Candidatus Bathyarchaeia archaeon]|jgi:hypothetical protein